MNLTNVMKNRIFSRSNSPSPVWYLSNNPFITNLKVSIEISVEIGAAEKSKNSVFENAAFGSIKSKNLKTASWSILIDIRKSSDNAFI